MYDYLKLYDERMYVLYDEYAFSYECIVWSMHYTNCLIT